MQPQLVVQATDSPCCVCGSPLVGKEYVFWQRLEDGSSRAWHEGSCDEHIRGMTYGAESNADVDAREAEDVAEDRHLRSLEGE